MAPDTILRARAAAACAGLAVLAWAGGCLDGLGPGEQPSPLVVVSDTASRIAPPPSVALSLSSTPEADVAYISLPPGTTPAGDLAAIRNLNNGNTATVPLDAGGFDPVAVNAAVGDTIKVVVRDASGAVVLQMQTVVAASRRPIVVRTDPPPQKRDVPLNAPIVIVFSEPIDAATLTGASVQLLQGTTPVAGKLQPLDPDNLKVEFVPAAPLAPGTDHVLIVTQGIRDLDDEPLESPVSVQFTTVAGGPSGVIQVTTATTGVDLDGDGYLVTVVGGPQQVIGANDTVTISGLRAGTYDVTLGGVTVNCDVTSQSARTVTVFSGQTSAVTFDVACAAATQVAFGSVIDGNADIYVINSNGTGSSRLTTHPAQDLDPSWSPDGTKIAFRSYRDGNSEIYVMNADGTNPVRVTNNTAAEFEPVWSPDGSRIAFVSDRDANLDIYVMNADGSGVTRLTDHPSDDRHPAWSPDGSRIAFRSDRDEAGNFEIYVMNADGTDVVRLTNSPQYDDYPAWSPDGAKIAFSREECAGAPPSYYCDYDIFVMNADGSEVTQLTFGVDDDDTEPTWSPDGLRIAFRTVICPGDHSACYGGAILAIRGDGADRRELIGGDVFNPAWRP